MRKTACLLAAALAGCVSVEPAPDPRGAVAPGQRLVVMVYQAPGPWIVADPDSKAESAFKVLPLGGLLQNIQEERINELSKEIQPYLPRPRYDQALEASLIAALKTMHGGPVQTAAEAGISPQQRKDWNAAADPLDWRRRYFSPGPGTRAPRDYSKLLSLDDAVILDVNVSFGLEPDADDRTLPTLAVASRLARAGTGRVIWSREDRLADKSSSATLTEFRVSPSDLTDRLYAMAAPLGGSIATSLAVALNLTRLAPSVTVLSPSGDASQVAVSSPTPSAEPPSPPIPAPTAPAAPSQ